jgi:hypothetical protein
MRKERVDRPREPHGNIAPFQWDLSYRINYDYDFENRDTGYHSGRTMCELRARLEAFTRRPSAWSAMCWHRSAMTTAPMQAMAIGCAQAFGAALKHFFPNGVFVTAKYFREQDARNGPRGDNYWCRGIPFVRSIASECRCGPFRKTCRGSVSRASSAFA